MSRVVASAIEAAFEGDGQRHHDESHRSRHRGVKAVAAGAALVAAVQVARSQAPKLNKLEALRTLGKVTRLPDMVRDVPDRMRERLADSGWSHDADEEELGSDNIAEDEKLDEGVDEDEDYDEPEAEEAEAEGADEQQADADVGEEDEGPEAEERDEEPDDEGDEGPGDEGDDWPDDEDDDGGGGDAAEPEADAETIGALHRAAAVEQARQGLGIDTNGGGSAARGATPDVIEMLSDQRPPPLLTRTDSPRKIDPVTRPPEPPTTESDSRVDRRGGSSSKSRPSSSKSQSGGSKSRSSPPRSRSSSSKSRSGSAKSSSKKTKAGKR